MNDAMTFLKDAEQFILGASPFVLTMLGCIVLGYLLKPVKSIPNGLIPALVTIAGAVIFPLLTSSEDYTRVAFPLARRIMIGVPTGFAAWMLHNSILDKWLDPTIAKVARAIGVIKGEK